MFASVPDLPGVMAYGATQEEAREQGKVDRVADPGGHDRKRRRGADPAEGVVRGVSI
jgi:hypothetical protein